MRLSILERVMLTAFLVLAVTTFARGEEKPLPPIRLPISKQPVIPSAVTRLTPNEIFVIEADLPCLVLASREGFVTVEQETGPLHIRGVFADGNGKSERRKYEAKYLWLIEAATAGEVELLIVPQLAKSVDVVIRRTLIVSGVPPPEPAPPPDPVIPDPIKPDDPKPVVKSFRVFLIFESGATYPQSAINVLYGNVVEEWLNANCTGGKAGWRRRDQNLGGEKDPTFAAMWAKIQPKITTVPAVAVEVNGYVELIPVEATPAAMVAKFNTYRGVK